MKGKTSGSFGASWTTRSVTSSVTPMRRYMYQTLPTTTIGVNTELPPSHTVRRHTVATGRPAAHAGDVHLGLKEGEVVPLLCYQGPVLTVRPQLLDEPCVHLPQTLQELLVGYLQIEVHAAALFVGIRRRAERGLHALARGAQLQTNRLTVLRNPGRLVPAGSDGRSVDGPIPEVHFSREGRHFSRSGFGFDYRRKRKLLPGSSQAFDDSMIR